MFTHNKDLQFEVRIDRPDPQFATLLQEQFGGANGELKAAMQYFTQAFVLRRKNPKMYDLFMDIATEEFSHLEIVGSMITMLLDGLNDDLKQANERCDWMPVVATADGREQAIHQVAVNPTYLSLTGGGPDVVNSAAPRGREPSSTPMGIRRWICGAILRRSRGRRSSTKPQAVHGRSGCAGHPDVPDDAEVAHYQQFTAALNELPVNFPPGQLPGDDRFQNVAFNMSNGGSVRGPWNEGQGPWPEGTEWRYVEAPADQWLRSEDSTNRGETESPEGGPAVHGTKPFTHEQHVPAN